ncbi:MAG: nucleoside deaminase [Leptospira sp.]|nr:nucleoside deaminase [Leptospira sp.]
MDSLSDFFQRWREKRDSSPNEIPSYSEILTKNGQLLAYGFNSVEQNLNPLKHSEIVAIESALKLLNEKYLTDCILVTALEPCVLCAGAIIRVRIPEVMYFLPAKPGEGISSYSTDSIYLLNHFPKCQLIPKSEIKLEFLTFFKEKR